MPNPDISIRPPYLAMSVPSQKPSKPTMARDSPVFALLILTMLTRHALCCTFTITNACGHPIWPGTLAGAGTPQLGTTGFRLDSGGSVQVQAPSGWSGRIWARTGCAGNGTCETGDCGGKLECAGTGARPPVTLFEVTLGMGAGDDDYYDVSLVDGYNLPVLVAPSGGQGRCDPTGCAADLNSGCPKELQVEGEGGDEGGGGGGVVACKSACNAFGMDEYCCSGEYASPGTCKPSFYSAVFKRACPRAYSYAFDDGTSTFICKAFDYTITFCPSINGMKRSNGMADAQPVKGDSSSSNMLFVLHLPLLLLLMVHF